MKHNLKASTDTGQPQAIRLPGPRRADLAPVLRPVAGRRSRRACYLAALASSWAGVLSSR